MNKILMVYYKAKKYENFPFFFAYIKNKLTFRLNFGYNKVKNRLKAITVAQNPWQTPPPQAIKKYKCKYGAPKNL